MRASKRNKRKLALGAYLKQNSNGINAAGNLTGSLIDSITPPTSMAGNVGSGILKGAGAGAAFGPIGIAAGAVIGGVSGAINAKAAQKQQKAQEQQAETTEDQYLLKNAKKHGGKLLAKELNPIHGGQLRALSDDAVEVKAHNPSQTDSVELQDAFVDDDEVIDNQNRVFSNSLKLPNGKTVAKEAKRLEKQKAEDEDTRFAKANQHIDQKLDELFHYQESLKGEQSEEGMKKGGRIKKGRKPRQFEAETHSNHDHSTISEDFESMELGGVLSEAVKNRVNKVALKKGGIHINPANKGKFNALKKKTGKTTEELKHSKNPLTRKRATFAANAKKWHHELGGYVSEHTRGLPKVMALLNTPPGRKPKFDLGGEPGTPPEKVKVGVSQNNIGSIPTGHPRASVDEMLMRNYPGRTLEELDEHNVPVTPGQMDPQAVSALRRGYTPSISSVQNGKLFTEGPNMIAKKMGGRLANGGRLSSRTLLEQSLTEQEIRRLVQARYVDTDIAGKGGYKKGGKMKMKPGGYYDNSPSSTLGPGAAPDKADINWNQGLTQLATFGPNIVSSALQKRLVGPAGPQLESQQKLERVDPSAQYAEVDREGNQTNALLTRNTAQAGNLASGLGATLSRRIAGKNQIAGQTQNINAQIQGQEAYINSQVGARNVGRVNEFRQAFNDFTNRKLQMSSENVSNLSGKVLQQGRERNMMKLDRDKYAILSQQYQDLPGEMRAKYPTLFDYYNKTLGKKMGGRIGRRKLNMKNC